MLSPLLANDDQRTRVGGPAAAPVHMEKAVYIVISKKRFSCLLNKEETYGADYRGAILDASRHDRLLSAKKIR